MGVRLEAEYVLVLRWSLDASSRQASLVSDYLRWLSGLMDVTVVDGSDPVVFAAHHELWAQWVAHVPPDPWPGANGKVAGVVTGVRAARHEHVVIADDDVRYDLGGLTGVLAALEAGADLVRPQNVFTHDSWHTRWDTARTLVNRAFGHDYPGTHGLRRSAFLAMGGYRGDVLFENLELARTVLAWGGEVRDLPGLFVGREPPTAHHFLCQRVRQAYDDLGQPGRLAAELCLLPALLLSARSSPPSLAAALLAGVAVGDLGRRRAGGAAVYPRTAPLWVPLWVAERAVCIWLALAQRALGGVRYRGRRVRTAATSMRALRQAALETGSAAS